MNEPLWTPSPERVAATSLDAFRRDAEAEAGRSLPDYHALHAWSVADPETFWRFYAEYVKLPLRTPPREIMSVEPMPYTAWFEGATLNYAEALLYPPGVTDGQTAIIAVDETGLERQLSYLDLRQEVARCAAALRRSGVEEGDRVAAYACNTPETVTVLLACASLGAVFSSCSPDFGFEAAFARFGQIAPKVLVAYDGYAYNGKRFSTLETVEKLAREIEGLEHTVIIPYHDTDDTSYSDAFVSWRDWLGPDPAELSFTPLPFDHPLYILYSSGTTGLPKAMVHRAGGALITHHKEHFLHSDVKPGDVVFYFTTCGWMMWNWLVSGLALGATIVLYEGSPTQPDIGATWRLAAKHKLTFFGTSARFLHSCKDAGLTPRDHDLSALKTIASTGSPLSPAGFRWVYDAVKPDVHLASISGGTDIVSCFMLGVPTLPVYPGQIQGPGLGVDLAAFDDDGRPVTGEPGELVCRKPTPSMPLRFWNDPDFSRYQEAFFGVYPGVWRHGDLIEITEQGGIVVYGRSDATLNPGGVRIGTAEIYRPLELLPEVSEAAAVGKKQDGDEVVWLFVVLKPEVTLDDGLRKTIRDQIRRLASPRHVPKQIFQVTQLPRTRSGKTTEIAISKLVNGQEVKNRQVMANPEALDEIAVVVGQS
ncbi:MAG: acetoacetate--CoA ligase [Trueperaceae bacterium]|nr:acetoacetate--CoA ligase [Trueperaceae bacterium]